VRLEVLMPHLWEGRQAWEVAGQAGGGAETLIRMRAVECGVRDGELSPDYGKKRQAWKGTGTDLENQKPKRVLQGEGEGHCWSGKMGD
jgi:hypothetical protein